MKTFINSQFGYCPLVRMFCNSNLNNRINRTHEKALRIVHSDQISTFENLLMRDNSVTIHVRNLHTLAIELYKVASGLAPEMMWRILPLKQTMRYPQNIFEIRNIHSTKYGIESLAHFGPRLWDIVPQELKEVPSIDLFKKRIRLWILDNCKLCKEYVKGAGYTD